MGKRTGEKQPEKTGGLLKPKFSPESSTGFGPGFSPDFSPGFSPEFCHDIKSSLYERQRNVSFIRELVL